MSPADEIGLIKASLEKRTSETADYESMSWLRHGSSSRVVHHPTQ